MIHQIQKQQVGFPLYISGDTQLVEQVQLTLDITLSLQKSYLILLPFTIIKDNHKQFLQPIAQVEVITQTQRQYLLKNRNLIKQGVNYIYFPASIRVDEKIYKIYLNNFENLVEKAPKTTRNNFSRFICWEEGKGQHSLNYQKTKVNEILSNIVKMQIEKKIQTINAQIKQLQGQQMSYVSIMRIFTLKNKLIQLFKHLRLNILCNQLLQNLWRQILKQYSTICRDNQIKFKSPFIEDNIYKIIEYFQHQQKFITIANFTFIRMYAAFMFNMGHLEALRRLRFYIDHITSTVLKRVNTQQQQIIRYLWAIQLIQKCEKQAKQAILPPMFTRIDEYNKLKISIYGSYRNSIERIGYILYSLDNFIIFPTTIQKQVDLVLNTLNNKIQNHLDNHPLTTKIKIQQIISFQQHRCDSINKIIENFTEFIKIYIQILEKMFKTLQIPSYMRVAQSLKLTIMKAYIYYLYDNQKIKEANLSKAADIDLWSSLVILEDIYRLVFLKAQSEKLKYRNCILKLLTEKQLSDKKELWIGICSLLKDIRQDDDQEEKIIGLASQFKFQQLSPHIHKVTCQIQPFLSTVSSFQNFYSDELYLVLEKTNGIEQKIILKHYQFKQNKFSGQLNTQHLLQFKIKHLLLISNGIEFILKQQDQYSNNDPQLFILNSARIIDRDSVLKLYQHIWTKISIKIHLRQANQITKLLIENQNLEILQQIQLNDRKQLIKISNISQANLDSLNEQVIINAFVKPYKDKKQIKEKQVIKIVVNLKQNDQQYQLKTALMFEIEKAFKVSYAHIEEIQEFKIVNLSNIQLQIYQKIEDFKVVLQPSQQLSLNQRKISINFPNVKPIQIDLSELIPAKELKPENQQYFLLEIEIQEKYQLFKKISIKSQEVGEIKVVCFGKGYQIIGKIQGKISYLHERRDQKIIDLWLIATKLGKIYLPEIIINGKKGIWKSDCFIAI